MPRRVSKAGNPGFQGIRLNVYRGMSDPASDDKVGGGVRQALAKLIPLKGLDLPDTFDGPPQTKRIL